MDVSDKYGQKEDIFQSGICIRNQLAGIVASLTLFVNVFCMYCIISMA
jgi:hypothetical protein